MKTSATTCLGQVWLPATSLLPPSPPIPAPAILGLVRTKEMTTVCVGKSPASAGSKQADNCNLLSTQSFWVPVHFLFPEGTGQTPNLEGSSGQLAFLRWRLKQS